ncbi:MAG TPA: manganese catalase family protein, partial [Bryobacteraceae bacterium]|nr:manganese catalase family protein [Bryobacteraceae bacterium]
CDLKLEAAKRALPLCAWPIDIERRESVVRPKGSPMFHHVKELQFNARVSEPDPRFASLLLEQFGGGNGELKAAMQYFTQAFGIRQSYPDKYDLLMDIATEEFSHLEIVGATITMLLEGLNQELKETAENSGLSKLMRGTEVKETMIHNAMVNPSFAVLSGGGPTVSNCQGVPWQGSYVNSNGDLTVDLRSDIAAEGRAKIVYEYLLQFTDDPFVKESLGFLMTREIAHFQMFAAALDSIEPNFPPGILQGDARFRNRYYNLSDGASARGPWNQGRGPWKDGEEWVYIDDPIEQVRSTRGQIDAKVQGSPMSPEKLQQKDRELSQRRSSEIKEKVPHGENQWSAYPQTELASPGRIDKK